MSCSSSGLHRYTPFPRRLSPLSLPSFSYFSFPFPSFILPTSFPPVLPPLTYLERSGEHVPYASTHTSDASYHPAIPTSQAADPPLPTHTSSEEKWTNKFPSGRPSVSSCPQSVLTVTVTPTTYALRLFPSPTRQLRQVPKAPPTPLSPRWLSYPYLRSPCRRLRHIGTAFRLASSRLNSGADLSFALNPLCLSFVRRTVRKSILSLLLYVPEPSRRLPIRVCVLPI